MNQNFLKSMKQISLVLIILLGSLFAQNSNSTALTAPLLRFGTSSDSVTVTRGEFEYVYQKNNGGWDKAKKSSPSDIREYLDLYVKFKRKVMDAESLGMDTVAAFKLELEGYRKQLAQPYLVEKNVLDTLIKEAYERSKIQIKASHLLLTIPPDATPADTLMIYQKIMAIRDSILKMNYRFEDMAVRHSQDPSVTQNRGDLGYFSAFNMVFPFEQAAFSTPVGKVSMPVRTQFGYHLVNVTDRYQSKGTVHSAHIIIRVGESYSAKDSATAIAKIKELYDKAKKGEDFATLAQQFSDDPTTAKSGGDLGVSRLLPEMEEWKRKLNKGEVSQPFTTAYGWHILKVTEIDPLPSFEESKGEYRQKVQKDQRSNLPQEVFLAKLKKSYTPQWNNKTIESFISTLSKEYTSGRFTPDSTQESLYAQPLLELGLAPRKILVLKDFFPYYKTLRAEQTQGPTISEAVHKHLEGFLNAELLKYEEQRLPEKYQEYRELLKEYRDGILLFSLTEKKVWKKAMEDTVGLKSFFESRRDSFIAGERIKIKEYRSTDSSRLANVYGYLNSEYTDKEIDSLVNQGSSLHLRIQPVIMERKNPEVPTGWFDQAPTHPTVIRKRDKNFVIQVYQEKLPAGKKSFEEAKSECITKYQEYLEKQWNQELANRFPVVIREDVFKKLYK
jgi:peptidyl-prolyl cis-trans isomerase SurA